MLTIQIYLADPCGASSLPYSKMAATVVPPFMRIAHDRDFDARLLERYTDTPYFRLRHDLKQLPNEISPPAGYVFSAAAPEEYAEHINGCYTDLRTTAESLLAYVPSDLWLVIRDEHTGRIAASGIAVIDEAVREGVLEWIQVSPDHRRKGLGRAVVLELLRRMADRADFATVSGKVQDPASPEALYRACGFIGNDVWHILRERT